MKKIDDEDRGGERKGIKKMGRKGGMKTDIGVKESWGGRG
jgi:hypothetical protein